MLKPGKPSFSRRVPLSSLSTPLKEMFSDPFWNVSGPLLRLGEYGKKHAAERSAEQLGHNVRWENEVLERRAEINDDYADDEEDIEEEDEPEEEETYPGYVHVEFTDDDDGEEWYEEDGEDSVQYARRSRTTLEENNNLVNFHFSAHRYYNMRLTATMRRNQRSRGLRRQRHDISMYRPLFFRNGNVRTAHLA